MMNKQAQDRFCITKSPAMQTDIAKKVISLIDLTSLNAKDDHAVIEALCAKAVTPLGNVAAVCIFPQFVRQAKNSLSATPIQIATVANFPQGGDKLGPVLEEITQAITDGADEIDVVVPYSLYLKNQADSVVNFLQSCKQACQHKVMKVILETGALQYPELIAKASHDAIQAGADFLKTSTGKIEIGATLEAAATMLTTIKAAQPQGKSVGFKASGGIRTLEQAVSYLELAESIMGKAWISPATFRFGASGLLDQLV